VQHDGGDRSPPSFLRVSALLQKHLAAAPAQQSPDHACPRSAGLPTDRITPAAGTPWPTAVRSDQPQAKPLARYLRKPCDSQSQLYSKVIQSIRPVESSLKDKITEYLSITSSR
jgi:hypothetical protein